MTLDEITTAAIDPALKLLPAVMDSPEARVALLAIGLQESRFQFRFQKRIGRPAYRQGPAHGFWQMERGGGVLGVLAHKRTKKYALELCHASAVPAETLAVWQAIENDDVLAAGFARLLLWSDLMRLPALGNAAGCWELYTRVWRPGRPRRDTWDAFYRQALQQEEA